MSRYFKTIAIIGPAIYVILLIPSPAPLPLPPGERKPFAWRQDDYWSGLEARFRTARALPCDSLATQLEARFAQEQKNIVALAALELEPEAPVFAEIESTFFALVHVDEQTGLASIVEAHIERGVAIATLEEYLQDKKLRVMVLRLQLDFHLPIAFLLSTGVRSPQQISS